MYFDSCVWYNHKSKKYAFLVCLVWRLNNTTKEAYFLLFFYVFSQKNFPYAIASSDFVLLEGFNRKFCAAKGSTRSTRPAGWASKLSTRKIFDCPEEGNRGEFGYGFSIGHSPLFPSFLVPKFLKVVWFCVDPIILYTGFGSIGTYFPPPPNGSRSGYVVVLALRWGSPEWRSGGF